MRRERTQSCGGAAHGCLTVLQIRFLGSNHEVLGVNRREAKKIDDAVYELWLLINSTWLFPKRRAAFHDELNKIRKLIPKSDRVAGENSE